MPKYIRVKSTDEEEETELKWKFEVLLEDKKSSKYDLRFLPNASFASEKVAKDFTALLAVWHFQVVHAPLNGITHKHTPHTILQYTRMYEH